MQVMRLEKLVKLLEDQQDRAQAQRTRLEHRIAQLEVSLREQSRNNNNRYVRRKCYSPQGAPRVGNERHAPPRAFSTSTFCLDTVACSRGTSESSRYCANSPKPSPRRFHINGRYSFCSDGEETFVCERCRGEIDGRFAGKSTGDAIIRVQQNPRQPARENLYGWLMGTMALGAFGEPTRALNKFCEGSSSSDENTDRSEIVNPLADFRDCSGESRCRYEKRCRRLYRGCSSKRFFCGASPRQRNPIIRVK